MLFSSVRNNYSDRAGWYLRGSCRQNSLPALVLIASSMTFLLICTNMHTRNQTQSSYVRLYMLVVSSVLFRVPAFTY